MKVNVYDPFVTTEVVKNFGGNKIESLKKV